MEATLDDATVGIDLIGAIGDVASVTGDAAYDTVAFYEAASALTRGCWGTDGGGVSKQHARMARV